MNAQLAQLLSVLKGAGGKAMGMGKQVMQGAQPFLKSAGDVLGKGASGMQSFAKANPMLSGFGVGAAAGMIPPGLGMIELAKLLENQPPEMWDMSKEQLMELLKGRGAISTKAPGMSPTEGFAEQFKKY
jgi:hypothetical protein